MNGAQALLEMLARLGVRQLFGNPGTTELPLSDAVAGDRRFEYILGLQEVPVMAIADGYALASGRVGVVNLHAACGLGSAMGVLYNAHREGTPLLVTAGQQDRRLQFAEPILGGDLVAVARPWTKWAAEVRDVRELPVAIRRAVQTALTPPTGPVFLSLPVDVLLDAAEGLDMTTAPRVDARVRPVSERIDDAARRLLAAERPVILAGCRVTERGASPRLAALAEWLGAPVLFESGANLGRLPIATDHPCFAGAIPLWSPEVRDTLAPYDLLLAVGVDLLKEYVYHEPSRAIPEGLPIVHVDDDPWQIGKNFPVELGVLGHLDESLQALVERVRSLATEPQRLRAQQALATRRRERERMRQDLETQIAQRWQDRPLASSALMGAVARAIDGRDVAVVEEAVTTTNMTLQRLGALRSPEAYFGHRGWTLGWGLGCAVGAQLAWPQRRVVAILGDGAALYGITGLWTAARYRLPVVFVVCHNAQYRILKVGARGFQLPEALADHYVGFDIDRPEVDFVGLARSLGVAGVRVDSAEGLVAELRAGLEGDQPLLIEAPIERGTPSRLDY